MKVVKWIFVILAIVCNAFILINGLLPGNESTTVAGPIVEIVANIINFFAPGTIAKDPYPSLFVTIIRKLFGHFGLFGFDGVLTYLALTFVDSSKVKRNLIISLIIGLLVAVISELLQLIPEGRSCELHDMAVDYSGYLIATILTFVIVKCINKRKKA